MISFSACKGGIKHDAYKRVYEKYNDINAFTAEAEITVKSNLTTNTYKVVQYYLAPDNFKMEIVSPESLKGTGYTFCEGKVTMYSNDGNTYSLSDYVPEDKNYVFINHFFESYYKSEDAFVETSGGIGEDSTVFKNILTENNPERYSQSVWINNKSLLPEKLVTCNMDGEEVLSVEFKSFSFEEIPEKNLFKE